MWPRRCDLGRFVHAKGKIKYRTRCQGAPDEGHHQAKGDVVNVQWPRNVFTSATPILSAQLLTYHT